MGKRFLLILLSMFLFAGTAFAYGTPRWFSMPISVYVPTDATVVTSAFKSWQSVSGSSVRFVFRSSANLASRSNITVSFVDKLPNNKRYMISRQTTLFGKTEHYAKNGYFYKAHISIARYDERNKLYSNAQIRAAALRAVGEVLGIKPFQSDNAVMSTSTDYSKSTISRDDINALNHLYKR